MTEHSREYTEYLKSERWKALRVQMLVRAGHKCERCAATTRLEVHHKDYFHLQMERPEDLEVLCSSCHEEADRRRKWFSARNEIRRSIERQACAWQGKMQHGNAPQAYKDLEIVGLWHRIKKIPIPLDEFFALLNHEDEP